MTVILDFDSISVRDVATAGGKGANLGEMASAGLPVPPGMVIATAGYDRFIDETGIAEGIQQAARTVDPDDQSSAEMASRTIERLFREAAIPQDLAETITAAYAGLTDADDPAVAVRSSATAEDLEDASFAGQQDTYLNIRGAEALLTAVRLLTAGLRSVLRGLLAAGVGTCRLRTVLRLLSVRLLVGAVLGLPVAALSGLHRPLQDGIGAPHPHVFASLSRAVGLLLSK